ncbi:MAG: NAD(P)-dependent oxidoreductase [Gemmatimonadaceae bacterium]
MADRPRVALLTGATGFIGSHVAEELVRNGWRVRCLVRSSSVLKWVPVDDVTLINGDITESGEDLDRAVRNVSVVFHLAAVTSASDDADYTAVNVEGTQNVVNAMRRVAPQAVLVFCSSLAAAGPAGSDRPLNETDPPLPVSPYGSSKLIGERIVEISGLAHVIVRLPAVYGPRDTDILAVFRMASRGFAVRLAPVGQQLSMLHVHDAARGIVRAAELGGAGLYYLTDGMTHTWDSVMENVGRSVGRKFRIIRMSRFVARGIARMERVRTVIAGSKPLLTQGRVFELSQANWTCDDTRARLDLDYESQVTLPEGMRLTVEWYRVQGLL